LEDNSVLHKEGFFLFLSILSSEKDVVRLVLSNVRTGATHGLSLNNSCITYDTSEKDLFSA